MPKTVGAQSLQDQIFVSSLTLRLDRSQIMFLYQKRTGPPKAGLREDDCSNLIRSILAIFLANVDILILTMIILPPPHYKRSKRKEENRKMNFKFMLKVNAHDFPIFFMLCFYIGLFVLQCSHISGLYVSRNTYIRAGVAEWKITNPVHVVCVNIYLYCQEIDILFCFC